MFPSAGKNGCRGKASVLLCGVSSEYRSTTYCSNRLPASKALLENPLKGRTPISSARKGGLRAFAPVSLHRVNYSSETSGSV